MNVTFRNEERKDTLLILQCIKELADTEIMLNMSDWAVYRIAGDTLTQLAE